MTKCAGALSNGTRFPPRGAMCSADHREKRQHSPETIPSKTSVSRYSYFRILLSTSTTAINRQIAIEDDSTIAA